VDPIAVNSVKVHRGRLQEIQNKLMQVSTDPKALQMLKRSLNSNGNTKFYLIYGGGALVLGGLLAFAVSRAVWSSFKIVAAKGGVGIKPVRDPNSSIWVVMSLVLSFFLIYTIHRVFVEIDKDLDSLGIAK